VKSRSLKKFVWAALLQFQIKAETKAARIDVVGLEKQAGIYRFMPANRW
jgi:hypothetical protein